MIPAGRPRRCFKMERGWSAKRVIRDGPSRIDGRPGLRFAYPGYGLIDVLFPIGDVAKWDLHWPVQVPLGNVTYGKKDIYESVARISEAQSGAAINPARPVPDYALRAPSALHLEATPRSSRRDHRLCKSHLATSPMGKRISMSP